MRTILDFRFWILDCWLGFRNLKSKIQNLKLTRGYVSIIFLLVFLGASAVAGACPLCKDALVEPGQRAAQSRAARGYAFSIAALLGTPAVLIGGITTLVARSSHRKPRRPC